MALTRKKYYMYVYVTVLYFTSIFYFLHSISDNDSFIKNLADTLSKDSLQNSSQTLPVDNRALKEFNRTDNSGDNSFFSAVSLESAAHRNSFNKTLVTPDKIDWNDYELMYREAIRKGPGEQGQGYNEKLDAQQLEIVNRLIEKYHYNAYASDHISLERSINDTRTDVCKKKLYLKDLPENSVSFVVIFNNERNTTLLRTIHGIVNRSPKKLLREIIMVDDCSTDEELRAPLEEYIAKHFTKVKLVRNIARQGLIRSRIIGADHTSGSFIVFLDAHIEVNYNFLPPLIEPMVLDYRTIVSPMVDIVDKDTLAILAIVERERGAFDWSLVYQRLPVTQEDQSEPHSVVSMIGCAIAITRRWWEEIDKFDRGLDIWGGEQYEISFKSWMCGGKVVDAPCSRVAHMYRSLPYIIGKSEQKNLLRVASVWMDEYKEYLLQRRNVLRDMDPGNLTSQLKLRKRLKCKSFDWFMKEVAPDIPQFFPLVEPPLKAWGKIKSNFNQSLCMTTQPQRLSVVTCDQADVSQYRNDWRLQIRENYDTCLTNPGNDYILMWNCLLVQKNPDQKFVWDRVSGRIINLHSKLCLDFKADTLQIYAKPCYKTSVTQSWTFEVYNSTLVDSTWEQRKHLFHPIQ